MRSIDRTLERPSLASSQSAETLCPAKRFPMMCTSRIFCVTCQSALHGRPDEVVVLAVHLADRLEADDGVWKSLDQLDHVFSKSFPQRSLLRFLFGQQAEVAELLL
jgi:hypothetical protein